MSDNGNERQAKRLKLTRHERKKLYIHIAMLHSGWIRWELHQAIMLFTHTDKRFQWSTMPYSASGYGTPTDSNRNRIARDSPKDADYVVMIDSDVVPDIKMFDVFEKIQASEEPMDVIGFPVPVWRGTNKPPTVAVSIKPLGDEPVLDFSEGGFTDREAIAGIFILSRRILDDPEMKGAFFFQYDTDGVTVMTEDYTYCQVARDNGYKIWSADDYICDHIKELSLKRVRTAIYAAEVGVDALYGEGRDSKEQGAEDGEAEESLG